MFSTVPVMRLSMQTTLGAPTEEELTEMRADEAGPAGDQDSHRVRRGRDGTAADRVVFEAEPAHALGLPGIASVEHDGPAHQGRAPRSRFRNLNSFHSVHERERIGAGGGLVGGSRK